MSGSFNFPKSSLPECFAYNYYQQYQEHKFQLFSCGLGLAIQQLAVFILIFFPLLYKYIIDGIDLNSIIIFPCFFAIAQISRVFACRWCWVLRWVSALGSVWDLSRWRCANIEGNTLELQKQNEICPNCNVRRLSRFLYCFHGTFLSHIINYLWILLLWGIQE